jgi:hypothetical protein
MDRRRFLATAGAAVVAAATPAASPTPLQQPAPGKARFRTGLVAYSFQRALAAKTMTYEDLIRIAVDTGTDGIDMTVYWFPSTTDDYLFSLRRWHIAIVSRSTALHTVPQPARRGSRTARSCRSG